jgi:hypothetical protein
MSKQTTAPTPKTIRLSLRVKGWASGTKAEITINKITDFPSATQIFDTKSIFISLYIYEMIILFSLLE